MASLRDVSSHGVVSSKELYNSLIKGAKLTSTDTFADLKLRAYNTDESKYLTVVLSIQSDTPKVTLAPTGVTPTTTIISGVATPAANNDASNKSYVDTSITTHAAVTATHGATGAVVGTTNTQTLTNKTITDSTNTVTADGLRSATTTISVSAATAPTAGQILTATSNTTATWQNTTVSQKPMGTNITGNITLDNTTATSHRLVILSAVAIITIPNDTNIAVGSEYDFTLLSANNLTFQAAAGVTLYFLGTTGLTGNSAILYATDVYGTVTLKKVATTWWIVLGPVST